jgi:regulator of cell morphogenesis and NO signaling
MAEGLESLTVGDIVATNFRAAAVLDAFGIDFCCGGRRTLAEACRRASADPTQVIQALDALPPPALDDDNATRWPVDRIVDHIVRTHHTYVRNALPSIARHLARLVEVHGKRHPELAHISAIFEEMSAELSLHLLKEEHVLFPYLRDLAGEDEADALLYVRRTSPFGTVENPIRMMEQEHREAADALRTIRDLTHGYAVPADGCATYGVCMAELAEFERDLHRHVHLENNVLFPRALALEQQR